jgi:hypothetical protein
MSNDTYDDQYQEPHKGVTRNDDQDHKQVWEEIVKPGRIQVRRTTAHPRASSTTSNSHR